MSIRKAAGRDIEHIHKLDKESVKYHQRLDKDFYTISQKWWKIKIASQLEAIKNPDNLILVAEKNGEIIGYVWGYIEKTAKLKIGKIQDLIVTKKYRRRCIALALIKDIMDFFREKKCIISETAVNIENEPAIKTYEKAGFKKNEYKMRLNLYKMKKFKPFG
ncbi:GNAT family N-acetyltransferase [archaeon]|nr:GNAT family N-acetyltransferase [archaeon]